MLYEFFYMFLKLSDYFINVIWDDLYNIIIYKFIISCFLLEEIIKKNRKKISISFKIYLDFE